MAIKPRGSTKKRFEVLVKTLDQCAHPDYLADLGSLMADKAYDLIDQGFRRQTDPYGTPWAERARRYSWPILDHTGRMRGGFRALGDRNGLRIRNSRVYFRWHQRGTEDDRLVARMMAPEEAEGMGEWDKPMAKVVNDYVRETFRGL